MAHKMNVVKIAQHVNKAVIVTGLAYLLAQAIITAYFSV